MGRTDARKTPPRQRDQGGDAIKWRVWNRFPARGAARAHGDDSLCIRSSRLKWQRASRMLRLRTTGPAREARLCNVLWVVKNRSSEPWAEPIFSRDLPRRLREDTGYRGYPREIHCCIRRSGPLAARPFAKRPSQAGGSRPRTSVLLCQWLVHRDRRLFDRADELLPEPLGRGCGCSVATLSVLPVRRRAARLHRQGPGPGGSGGHPGRAGGKVPGRTGRPPDRRPLAHRDAATALRDQGRRLSIRGPQSGTVAGLRIAKRVIGGGRVLRRVEGGGLELSAFDSVRQGGNGRSRSPAYEE